MYNPYDFTGKRIVIVGATSGIGKATTQKLSEQGAQLVLIGRNNDSLEYIKESIGDSVVKVYSLEFGQTSLYKKIFDDIVSDGQKIDGLVYCAGTAKTIPISMLNRNTLEESMSINFYSFVEFASLLSKKKYHQYASIVGISSIAIKYPSKCQSAYVASKSAMSSVVTPMAIELADKGIRINTVLPSYTNTKMLRDSYDASESEIKEMVENQVLGISEPDDIADIIMFLLSDASRAITGREIYADGGTIPDLTLHR